MIETRFLLWQPKDIRLDSLNLSRQSSSIFHSHGLHNPNQDPKCFRKLLSYFLESIRFSRFFSERYVYLPNAGLVVTIVLKVLALAIQPSQSIALSIDLDGLLS